MLTLYEFSSQKNDGLVYNNFTIQQKIISILLWIKVYYFTPNITNIRKRTGRKFMILRKYSKGCWQRARGVSWISGVSCCHFHQQSVTSLFQIAILALSIFPVC